ncbi:Hydroxyisourate hydrolase [Chlorella sorokiniana]|uniref:5-hydroxyisourate hydrolase n=1 Tax=Chlorella sorokiniana TaxID=3076 RepID=A0A2P6TFK2_CHLSO|nr:Hydroxyisourate hydrolase [Chlorella sorokiniana]|eukprot:PRW32890.1 Hydroxyisourate hydrolase [Chlorella sorokiniana]
MFGGAGEPGPPPAPAAAARADAPPLRSPITTHVLDTCLGRPAPGVGVTLARLAPGSAAAWELVAAGATNRDGRIPDLLPPADWVQPGHYRITFDVAEYQARCAAEQPAFFGPAASGGPARRFYPSVSVEFEIQPQQAREHFHVPLTWNPFGYSTYRGS